MSYPNNDEFGRAGQDEAKRLIDALSRGGQGERLSAEFEILRLCRVQEKARDLLRAYWRIDTTFVSVPPELTSLFGRLAEYLPAASTPAAEPPA